MSRNQSSLDATVLAHSSLQSLGNTTGNQTLLRAFSRFQQQRSLRPNTITARRSALRSFSAFYDGDLLSVGHKDIERWLDSRPLSASSRNDYLSYLHCFYEWAIREELTETDPTVRIPTPRKPRRLPRPIAEGLLIRAIDAADPRMAAMLVLASYAGLRCMDIANLRVEDLTWGTPSLITIRESKGDKDRVVPLAVKAEKALRNYGIPKEGPLFPKRGGLPYAASSISMMVNSHLHGCGVPDTAHALRHRFGTQFFRKSKDIRLTQEMMGHSSIATTQSYVAFSPDAAARVMDEL